MIFSLFFALVACGDGAKDTASATGEADLANGQQIHDTKCMACHAANLAMQSATPELSDAALEDVIVNGFGSMPAQSVSGQDLVDLIAYLRDTYGG